MENNLDENGKLARKARRDASNEAGLILTAFGALLWIVLIVLDRIVYLGLNISIPMWGAIAFIISAGLSITWYLIAKKIIKEAEAEYNEIMKARKSTVRDEHLETLRKRAKNKFQD